MEDSSETNPAQVENSKGAGPSTVIVGCGTTDLAGGTQASRPTSFFLDKLPPEVRVVIYEQLLMKQEDVEIAHEWALGTYRSISKCKFHTSGLHAMILRTCRTVYHEGLSILYGQNRFWFKDPDDLIAFAYGGVKKHALGDVQFGLRYEPHGRLALVRNVYLSLTKIGYELYFPWMDIIYSNEDLTMPIGFPKLQRLTLDFSSWRTLGQGINVRFPQTPF